MAQPFTHGNSRTNHTLAVQGPINPQWTAPTRSEREETGNIQNRVQTGQLHSDRNPFEINGKSILKIMKSGYIVQNISMNIFREELETQF